MKSKVVYYIGYHYFIALVFLLLFFKLLLICCFYLDRRRNNFPKHGYRNLGFKKLEELSTQDPETIIFTLIDPKKGFDSLLDTNLSNDYIVLIIRVLKVVCQSPLMQNKASILRLISKDNFITHLTRFMMELCVQQERDRCRSRHYWNNENAFWENLLVLCEVLLATVPVRATEVLPKVLVTAVSFLPQIKHQNFNYHNVLEELKVLDEKLKLVLEENERKRHAPKDVQEEEPPNDFKSLTIYPTSEEITTDKRSFLRKNVVEGAYKDVHTYLDVQFRLLREDFVAPLREAITKYMDQQLYRGDRKRISNIKIYNHVEFLFPCHVNDQVGVQVQFEFDKKRLKQRQNYAYSRRLMYGSLLVFTQDNFGSLLFGRVLQRDIKQLEKHQVVIIFIFLRNIQGSIKIHSIIKFTGISSRTFLLL